MCLASNTTIKSTIIMKQLRKPGIAYSEKHLKIPQAQRNYPHLQAIEHLINAPVYPEMPNQRISALNDEIRQWIRKYRGQQPQQQASDGEYAANLETIAQLRKEANFLKERLINSNENEQQLRLDDEILNYKSQIERFKVQLKRAPAPKAKNEFDQRRKVEGDVSFLVQKAAALKQSLTSTRLRYKEVNTLFLRMKAQSTLLDRDRVARYDALKEKERSLLNYEDVKKRQKDEYTFQYHQEFTRLEAILQQQLNRQRMLRDEIAMYKQTPKAKRRKSSAKGFNWDKARISGSVASSSSQSMRLKSIPIYLPGTYVQQQIDQMGHRKVLSISDLIISSSIKNFSHLRKSKLNEAYLENLNGPQSKPIEKPAAEARTSQPSEPDQPLPEAQPPADDPQQAEVVAKSYLQDLYKSFL